MIKQLDYVWLTVSWNNRVITAKCIMYINSIHSTCYSFYHVVLVKFYCDVISKSCLQLISTLIDTFFSKFRAFYWNKEEEEGMAQWTNLQWIIRFVNQMLLYITCEKSWGLHLAEPGLMAGRLVAWLVDKIWARLEILKACCSADLTAPIRYGFLATTKSPKNLTNATLQSYRIC